MYLLAYRHFLWVKKDLFLAFYWPVKAICAVKQL